MTSKKAHYAKLARIGCILCRQIGVRQIDDSPAEIHHIRRYGQKRENSEVIPLCAWHHRLDSKTSIHGLGHKGFEKYWGFSEEDLLEKVEDIIK